MPTVTIIRLDTSAFLDLDSAQLCGHGWFANSFRKTSGRPMDVDISSIRQLRVDRLYSRSIGQERIDTFWIEMFAAL